MSVSRIVDRAAAGVGDVDGAQVDRADLGRVVVEQRDEPELRDEVGDELLVPLAAQATEQAAVAGIEVAPDADRVAAVKPRVAAGRGPLHQEVALAVAQHEVRDDLLEGRVLLHPVARLVPPVALEGRDEGLEPVGPQPVPARLVDDRVARHDEDVLVAHS